MSDNFEENDLLDQIRIELNSKKEYIKHLEASLRERELFSLDNNKSLESRSANLEILEQLIPVYEGALIHLRGIITHERNDSILNRFREMKKKSPAQ